MKSYDAIKTRSKLRDPSVVMFVPHRGAEPLTAPRCRWVGSAGNRRRKGLPHAFRFTPLVIMGSLSGHASGRSAQGHFNNGKIQFKKPKLCASLCLTVYLLMFANCYLISCTGNIIDISVET